jgi:hypothetical protein
MTLTALVIALVMIATSSFEGSQPGDEREVAMRGWGLGVGGVNELSARCRGCAITDRRRSTMNPDSSVGKPLSE